MRIHNAYMTTLSALGFVLTAACSGAGPADAASPTAESAPETTSQAASTGTPRPHSPEKFVEHFDKDKNGTVELAELPERKRERLGRADVDGDGKLSADEIA